MTSSKSEEWSLKKEYYAYFRQHLQIYVLYKIVRM